MTLTSRIKELQKDAQRLRGALRQARRELWDAEYVRKNDARRKGESDEHWHKRRRRNRERVERREEVVEHLARKRRALIKEIEDLRKHRREYHEEQAEQRSTYSRGSTSIVTFDGKPVVEDLAYWLDLARKHGWRGYMTSGYRSPEYSESLCYGMCGAPSCPGRCAGRASNHAKREYPGPAADCTDYTNLERILAALGSPYWNDLPIDPVHFSRSGH